MHGKVICGGWLVRQWGAPPIRDGAFYEEGGRVLDLGDAAELRARHPQALCIGQPDQVVIPGFVNAHSRDAASPIGWVSPTSRWRCGSSR